MSSSIGLGEFERRIERQFGLSRGILLVVGMACLLLGCLSITLPLTVLGSFVRLIGLVLLASGAVKAVQLLLGRGSVRGRSYAWPLIFLQIGVDLAMGLILFRDWEGSAQLAAFAFGFLFVLEGLILGYMGLRAPTLHGGRASLLVGTLTLAIGLLILLGPVVEPLRWAGFFVGLKLLLFGGTLCWISIRALRSDGDVLYEAGPLTPEPGELYAVYFGTAFHLGVCIGEGEMVHYLNDNHVYRATWDQFLAGRIPQHWTYPDLEPQPLDRIVATALSEVGKTYPYNLLTFNCEHFAIFCKSGGTTRYSKYAQVAAGVQSVAAHPLLGLVAELNTRAVEWLAFQFGGPVGRRLSLAIRRFGAAVTSWLLTAGPNDRAA